MKQLLHKRERTALAPLPEPARIRRFLQEWANLKGDDVFLLAKRFPEFHAPAYDSPNGRVHLAIPENWTEAVRQAWRETNPRARDLKLAQFGHLAMDVLATSAMQRATWARNLAVAALFETIRVADRFTVCANPECSAPLFIRTRKNQTVCSADCRDAMQRKWQRDWWAAHGKNWRENRRKEKLQRRAKPKKEKP